MTIHEIKLPAEFNGEQFTETTGITNVFVREDTLFLESDLPKVEVQKLVDSHKPKPVVDPKAAILTRLGITAEEAKLLLG
jgi:hypothetical protein